MNPLATHGAPSWAELLAGDVEEAVAYYSNLFGWTSTPLETAGGGYHVMQARGVNVGGIMAVPNAMVPPMWCYYVTVDNVDRIAAKAEATGATIIVPVTDAPGVGRFCGFTDPQGAYLAVITYTATTDRHVLEKLDKAFETHGMFSWMQLQAQNVEEAASFYASLLGWTITEEHMETGPYHVIKNGGAAIGGIVPSPAPEIPPHWSAYVTVDDADRVLEAVEAAGGMITVPAVNVPTVGRLAHTMDPQGAHLAIAAYEQRQ